jgi:hypothetical protein
MTIEEMTDYAQLSEARSLQEVLWLVCAEICSRLEKMDKPPIYVINSNSDPDLDSTL